MKTKYKYGRYGDDLVKGDLSVLLRFALFTGLRGEEISYVHSRPVCPKLAGCGCENLHVVNKKNNNDNNGGISVIVVNRIMGQKHCYFTLCPTKLWQEFRALSRADYELRKFAHLQVKESTNGEVAFMDLRKFNYNINSRSEMKELGAEVLAGRAKTVSARHYLLNELDVLAEQYSRAWQKYLEMKYFFCIYTRYEKRFVFCILSHRIDFFSNRRICNTLRAVFTAGT